jgi:hypothetical protein
MPAVGTNAGKSVPAISWVNHLRSGKPKPAFAIGLWLGIAVVRPWYGIRRAARWDQASRRQRFTIVLSGLCALALVAGVAVAAAGVGRQGTPVSALDAPQTASVNRAQTAAWITQQVSPGTVVSCDPAMCRQVRGSGFPAAQLKALPAAATLPLSSGLIVATAAIRSQFGTSLAADAPLVIARFGSGATEVDVRVVAPDGAGVFSSQLAAEHISLMSAGQQLLRDPNIATSAAARPALLAGHADPRLLANLSVLAAQMPIRLVAFDQLSPGADSSVPLRGAEIGAASPGGLSVILSFLHAQQGVYRPGVITEARDASGPTLITVWFGAPGPVGTGS